MSRIGRMPVAIPAGVTVTVAEGNVVTVKGALGTLTKNLSPMMDIKVADGHVHVTRPNDEAEMRALHGLTRALLHDMVVGVSEGYKKVLMIVGVGYKAVKQGNKLMLYLGHSLMPVTGLPQDKFIMEDTDTVKLEVPSEDEIKKQGIDKMTTEKISSSLIIVVKGVDKQEVVWCQRQTPALNGVVKRALIDPCELHAAVPMERDMLSCGMAVALGIHRERKVVRKRRDMLVQLIVHRQIEFALYALAFRKRYSHSLAPFFSILPHPLAAEKQKVTVFV